MLAGRAAESRAMKISGNATLCATAVALCGSRILALAIRRTAAGERVVDPCLAAAALSEGVSPLTERGRQGLAATDRGAGIHRDRSDLVPVQGHGPKPPVLGDPEARGSESGRGCSYRRTQGLALKAPKPPRPGLSSGMGGRESFRHPAACRRAF